MKRVVLDTSVTISGLFWPGKPNRILQAARGRRIVVLTSQRIEEELTRVLAYPKFDLPPGVIFEILQERGLFTELVVVKSIVDCVEADPSDNEFLACAKDGRADYVVSSDHHLLDLQEFDGIPIVNPAEFCSREKLG